VTEDTGPRILYSRPTESIPPPRIQEWIDRSRAERLARLTKTPEELAAVIKGKAPEQLAMRPDDEEWSPVEVICHLRDVEDLSLLRFRMMIQMDEPMVPSATAPTDRERWGLLEEGAALFDQVRLVDQRQYARNDPILALEAFAQNRGQVLAFLGALTDAQWVRGAIHPAFGRVDFDGFTGILASHDDSHIAQLKVGI